MRRSAERFGGCLLFIAATRPELSTWGNQLDLASFLIAHTVDPAVEDG